MPGRLDHRRPIRRTCHLCLPRAHQRLRSRGHHSLRRWLRRSCRRDRCRTSPWLRSPEHLPAGRCQQVSLHCSLAPRISPCMCNGAAWGSVPIDTRHLRIRPDSGPLRRTNPTPEPQNTSWSIRLEDPRRREALPQRQSNLLLGSQPSHRRRQVCLCNPRRALSKAMAGMLPPRTHCKLGRYAHSRRRHHPYRHCSGPSPSGLAPRNAPRRHWPLRARMRSLRPLPPRPERGRAE